ncbi:unnamed protein product [Protopolystoma xenopodis]|uniref:Uncharacterized protein n=1 Tax=Protopolystoma xenopodis TaxID=117903 RepID=A0A3S4ZXR1_9PLAT|nr:unnamed protein product [Protopolystoma xenopodis]
MTPSTISLSFFAVPADWQILLQVFSNSGDPDLLVGEAFGHVSLFYELANQVSHVDKLKLDECAESEMQLIGDMRNYLQAFVSQVN